jgi:hypothetical protein
MGAGDLDRPRRPAAGHDAGHQPAAQRLRAIDLASGRFLYRVAHKAVSATFIAFCEQLLAAYRPRRWWRWSATTRSSTTPSWCSAGWPPIPRIVVLHGARYSPHDNPTERVWGALKAWLANNPP